MKNSILKPAILLIIFFMVITTDICAETKKPAIPEPLIPWESWVLRGEEEKLCPPVFGEMITRCAWPSRLRLFVSPEGGRFEQEWSLFKEGYIPLPGGKNMWPESVTLDHGPVPVISREDGPSIFAPKGEHKVHGIFKWEETPEMMRIPPESGITTLLINNKPVDFPLLDREGRIWLQKQAVAEKKEDTLKVRVFRRITDSIPMTVVTLLQLNISGKAREVSLESVLLKDSTPMEIRSSLPARIGPEGSLLIQARPGRWKIRLTTYFESQVYEIGPVKGAYGREIWSFEPRHHLRMTNIIGVNFVEPAQTDMPEHWKKLPAYMVNPGDKMVIKEVRRGDPEPAPDNLSLQRSWWLDFDGKGYTIHDEIKGTMSSRWSLAMNPPGILGRVTVDGTDRLITEHGKKPGVELRHGKLNMSADSRLEEPLRAIPAVGWDHDFQSVSAELNLPPGWRLFTASGVDLLPNAWIPRWSLWDFFLALIIALAMFMIRGKLWGILALITMVIIYHEPDSPRFVWLHILAALPLVKALPKGKFKLLAASWFAASMLALIIICIPFMLSQARVGLFPQLGSSNVFSGAPKRLSNVQEQRYSQKSSWQSLESYNYQSEDIHIKDTQPGNKYMSQEVEALIQTGPGLPVWTPLSRTYRMEWNGPVAKEQKIRLWLISPTMNMILSFTRVLLLCLLIIGIADIGFWRKVFKGKEALLFLALVFIPGVSWGEAAPGFPPSQMLGELRERLLEKPQCAPFCADISRMELKAGKDSATILLEVHASAETAVPIPGNPESWNPKEVLLDGFPVKGLFRNKDGVLWALIPEGIHKLTLMGNTGKGNTIRINLPMKPRLGSFTREGWDVKGIHENGRVDASIQLTRMEDNGEEIQAMRPGALPAFLSVTRVLNLGLTWETKTTVKRLTPTGIPVVASVPLIKGESVTTAGIHVESGTAMLNMGPDTKEISWSSTLGVTDSIHLKAPKSVPWTETWILDVNPLWHCEISGITVIHHQNEEDFWRPEWRPWPGEEVNIKITQPKAIPGRTVTIDNTHLKVTPGLRHNKSELDVSIRTSRGRQQEITLPESAKLQGIMIDGTSKPIRQEGRKVVVPLRPGKQKIQLEWLRPTDSSLLVKGPDVHVGGEAVNASVTFDMPMHRWILWVSGPLAGPAVLYWSYLIIIILGALALGRTTLTPLKTRHWLLLSLGLTQIPPQISMIIAGWLLALGLRKKYRVPKEHVSGFNFLQIILVVWTIVALCGLYLAIQEGLLGIPDMQISGNGSHDFELRWTQDRIGGAMPEPWALSLPMYVYHLLMLFWALWLAISLLTWLKWGWGCFSHGDIWREFEKKKKKADGKGKEKEKDADVKEGPPPLKGK